MTNKLMLGAVGVLLVLGTMPLSAQTRVTGGVVVESGRTSVGGGVVVGSPAPVTREVIVVEETHVPRGRAHGWWKNHGYRQVTVYSDGARFYPHRLERHPELRAIVIYERGGRYYRWADEDEGGKGNGHKHHGND
jgi:hypothetical protein